VKAAYTGVAATLIGGKTTHSIAGISKRLTGNISQATKSKLQMFWKSKMYLIINKFSMLSKSFLATLFNNISTGKQGSDTFFDTSFGGVNMLLCGNLHQFPPVAKNRQEFLFTLVNPAMDSTLCQSGHSVYKEFKIVIVLKEQKQVKDPVWHRMLTNLQKGQMQNEDIIMLRDMIVGSPSKDKFDSEPWSDTPLITPRHAVCIMWNKMCTQKWCRKTQQQLLICPAQDTIAGAPLTLQEQISIATYNTQQKNSGNLLANKVKLTKGLKVMVTSNLATDLDIMNDAQGEIVDIILGEGEPELPQSSVVRLKKMPSCVLVKLSRMRASQLDGLAEGVILVEPLTSCITVPMITRTG
jgi:PIF1-like helicase